MFWTSLPNASVKSKRALLGWHCPEAIIRRVEQANMSDPRQVEYVDRLADI
jgi:hypothetical protein